MRTIRTKVYSFNELSADAKQVAINSYRNNRGGYDLENEMLKESFLYRLDDIGFKGADIIYSLNNCQGDGLSFSADSYDHLKDLFVQILGKGKEKTAQLLADNVSVGIRYNGGHYCYADRGNVSVQIDWDCANIGNIVDKVENLLRDLYMDTCSTFETDGYKYFEDVDSDEYIAEHLGDTDLEYTKTGHEFNY